MAQQKLEELSKVLSRLEAALDRIDKKLAGGAGGGGAVGGEDKPFVIEWDKLVDTHIKPFRELSNKIGGDVAKHVRSRFSSYSPLNPCQYRVLIDFAGGIDGQMFQGGAVH